MRKIAFVFSGQGAQLPGMGKELFEHSPASRAVFEQIDRIRPATAEQCFHATKEELNTTINTQPCLFAVDLAAAEALREKGITPDLVAGFSLGEIPALAFSGVLDTESAFRLVCKRAEEMHKCALHSDGAMAAVIGMENGQVEEICSAHNVYPVNYNFKSQLVIAGEREKLTVAVDALKSIGGRVILLPVSGAFHTPLMNEASAELAKYVSGMNFNKPLIPIYSNITGNLYTENVGASISNQVKSPVRWQTTIENMANEGVDTFIEVGVGKTLCGFIKKILPEATVYNVEDYKSLEHTISSLNGV
ncbi:MAG: S-malonyltransferase [Bacillales bacterium]|nr:S-malonyltransferase [Bacillales bacterium]